MKKRVHHTILGLLTVLTGAAQAESAFVPVFIDARAEARLGPFPYDRAIYANALLAFEKLGAKGVVLKFFLDQSKGQGDEALAAAMSKLPVVLQARCDDGEANPNPLDARFSTAAAPQAKFTVNCKAGWIPLARLQQRAADLCFIDQPAVDVVLWSQRYQDRAVRTLYRCALDLARKSAPATDTGSTRKVDLGKAPKPDVLSLLDVLDGKVAPARIAGKIVVFGYEGPKSATFDTALGKLSAHRLFVANLLALEQLDH